MVCRAVNSRGSDHESVAQRSVLHQGHLDTEKTAQANHYVLMTLSRVVCRGELKKHLCLHF